jgi:hypothetical protein
MSCTGNCIDLAPLASAQSLDPLRLCRKGVAPQEICSALWQPMVATAVLNSASWRCISAYSTRRPQPSASAWRAWYRPSWFHRPPGGSQSPRQPDRTSSTHPSLILPNSHLQLIETVSTSPACLVRAIALTLPLWHPLLLIRREVQESRRYPALCRHIRTAPCSQGKSESYVFIHPKLSPMTKTTAASYAVTFWLQTCTPWRE